MIGQLHGNPESAGMQYACWSLKPTSGFPFQTTRHELLRSHPHSHSRRNITNLISDTFLSSKLVDQSFSSVITVDAVSYPPSAPDSRRAAAKLGPQLASHPTLPRPATCLPPDQSHQQLLQLRPRDLKGLQRQHHGSPEAATRGGQVFQEGE